MSATALNITLVQPDIIWEDIEGNLKQYETLIENISGKKEVVVLPEMFTTGFSMAPEKLAEQPGGRTERWMKEMAVKHRCIITGSIIIEDGGNYYNRLLWVRPDGMVGKYDKRHLFGYAGENQHYTGGDTRFIAQVKGIKICLMVCYDLRFPVWARNLDGAYDVLIYVANWPEKRSLAWKTLLHARAIENMSYVIGVNRVGTDANNIAYSGDSSAFGPLGEALWLAPNEVVSHTVTIEKEKLSETRGHFPFLNDADKFVLM